ncbi:MAG: threonine/serine dehydratase [Alphaproteobacteria bacterium]
MTFLPPSPDQAPGFSDVLAAAERLSGVAVRTRLLEAPLLNDRLGRRVLLKPECLQRTGSFKYRGASNKIRSIPTADQSGGVVAYSSGNHAQGVAAAARDAGIPSLIVMPSDAPAIKQANTRAWGAEVVLYDRFTEDREAIGEGIALERGAALVRPYDDPMVIAGQGTVGLEIAEDLEAMGILNCAAVVVPCGGGGLTAGVSLAISERLPNVPIYAAEPAGFDDTKRSIAAGTQVHVSPDARSICDSIISPTPGIITFAINARLLSDVAVVTDEEALKAVRTAFLEFKLVVEPGAAVALASVLEGRLDLGDGPVVVVVSGGNIDPAMFERALKTGD